MENNPILGHLTGSGSSFHNNFWRHATRARREGDGLWLQWDCGEPEKDRMIIYNLLSVN